MRILHVITQKPFATGSGVYLTGIMTELGRDHDQYLICGINQGDRAALPLPESALTVDPVVFETDELPFPVPGMSDVMPYRSSLYGTLGEDQTGAMLEAFLTRIHRAIRTFQPDAILFEHLYLLTAHAADQLRAAGCRLPLVGICHGSELRQFAKTDRWREKLRQGIGALDAIISTHDEQAQVIREIFDVDPNRIHIIGSGYAEAVFHPEIPDRRPPLEPLRLVYTGKLSGAKGVPELLAACDLIARRRPLQLTLIGSGADPLETAVIESTAAAKTYPVVLTGQLPQSAIAGIYHDSHILVLPSYYEGMPLVVPEALACGLGVAVTALPGFAGWLAPFADRVALIPRPAMQSADEPTPAGRQAFVGDIAAAILDLADRLPGTVQPDLTAMSWRGLAGRIADLLAALTDSQ